MHDKRNGYLINELVTERKIYLSLFIMLGENIPTPIDATRTAPILRAKLMCASPFNTLW